MKYVILLLLILSFGCFLDPAPNALDLKFPEWEKGPSLNLKIEAKKDSFFYENKKIKRDEIKSLFEKAIKENKGKKRVIMILAATKDAKNESIIFLMDVGQRLGIEVILETK